MEAITSTSNCAGCIVEWQFDENLVLLLQTSLKLRMFNYTLQKGGCMPVLLLNL